MRPIAYVVFYVSLALSSAWGFSPFYDVTRLGPLWWIVDSGVAAVVGLAGLAISMAILIAFAVREAPPAQG